MTKRVIYISWLMIAFVIFSWGAVAYVASAIINTATQRSNDTKLALTKANQTALNERVQALAESTKEKRDQLSALAGVDIVSIIDTIDAAGKSAGVDAKVSDASVAGSQTISKDGDALRGISFGIQGSGTFIQVMHAAQLYETLPLLSSVDQIDIERVQSSDPHVPTWHITARIRVQTLVQVSI